MTNLDFQSNVLSDFRYRYNRDKEHNDADKQVPDMLKSFNLRILNRKKLSDMRGDFTLYNNAGRQSTVDLGIVSENFFNHIEKFMISPQTEVSDHCKITLQIPNMINLKTNSAPYKWVHLKRAYKCSDNLRFRY